MEIEESEPVLLEPFSHQVGGHSSILCLDDRTICKPLIKQELRFYETLPSSMKKFTPEYGGVIQVQYEQDSHGYTTAVASRPSKSTKNYQVSSSKKCVKSRRTRAKNSSSLEFECELSDLYDNAGSGNGRRRSSTQNPWALKCHREHISKLRNHGGSSSRDAGMEVNPPSQKFVVLENLTWRFEYPCILDLKMGTRQYGDDATPAKIESQIAKAAKSTSVQLGVRICGMQVYQTTSGEFNYRNKYDGRKIGVDGFKEGLRNFLHNGNRLRVDALIPLIEKLQELKTVMKGLDTFRFYTSSLLLIYEGLDPEFAEEEGEESDPPPSCLSSLAMEPCGVDGGLGDGDEYMEDSQTRSRSGSRTISSLTSEAVDVRLIDFAHATHKELDPTKEHPGPDAGFIFGLSNLITTLKEILNDGNYAVRS